MSSVGSNAVNAGVRASFGGPTEEWSEEAADTRHSGKRDWWGRRGCPDLSFHILHGVVVVSKR